MFCFVILTRSYDFFLFGSFVRLPSFCDIRMCEHRRNNVTCVAHDNNFDYTRFGLVQCYMYSMMMESERVGMECCYTISASTITFCVCGSLVKDVNSQEWGIWRNVACHGMGVGRLWTVGTRIQKQTEKNMGRHLWTWPWNDQR